MVQAVFVAFFSSIAGILCLVIIYFDYMIKCRSLPKWPSLLPLVQWCIFQQFVDLNFDDVSL